MTTPAEGTAAELKAQIDAAKATLAELEKKAAAGLNTPSSTSQAPYGTKSNSDEQRLLMACGVSDVKQLLTMDVGAMALEPHMKQRALDLKKMVDCARLHSQIYNRDGREETEQEVGQAPVCKSLLTNRFAKNFDLAGRLKAFGSTSVGAGDEYVQTLVAENYMSEFEPAFQVGSLFNEIPMPSNPFRLPVAKDFTTARIIAEGAAATDANFGTSYIEFSATKWVEYYIIPEELNEDSVVPFIALGRDQVLKAHARAREQAILNGDTTGTHMDSNVTLAADARKSFKGLRKLALENGATVNFSGAGITEAKMTELVKKAGAHGVNPAESAYIVSSSGYAQLRALPSVTTVDKYGPNAVVRTGSLASYGGIPIIISQYVQQNLNAAGVYDGTTTTMTVVHLVNFQRFMQGRKRPIRVVAQRDPRAEYDRMQIAAYQRMDFKGYPQSANEMSSVLGINVLA